MKSKSILPTWGGGGVGGGGGGHSVLKWVSMCVRKSERKGTFLEQVELLRSLI